MCGLPYNGKCQEDSQHNPNTGEFTVPKDDFAIELEAERFNAGLVVILDAIHDKQDEESDEEFDDWEDEFDWDEEFDDECDYDI